MKIIITENQNYVLRRLQQFIEIVEDQIEGYEQTEGGYWCRVYDAESFLKNLIHRSIEIFIDENRNFFNDNSETGGSDMSILNKIAEENYSNYIRNLFVRKCGISRF